METNYFKSSTQKVSETLKEGVHYVIIEDRNGYKHKVANLDNPDICPRKGHITVEALKITKRIENQKIIKMVRDRKTGLLHGIPLGLDEQTGGINWETIILGDITHFDLSNIKDAQRWSVVSRSSILAGSPNQVAAPMFKVINKEKEAEDYKIEFREKLYVQEMAMKMRPNQMREIAFLLGINPDVNTDSLLESEILKIASNGDPKKGKTYKNFLAAYENKNKDVIVLLRKAVAYGLVKNDSIDGYKYNDILMGITENIALDFLKINAALLGTLKHEVMVIDEQDITDQQEVSELIEEEKKVVDEVEVSDKDLQILELQRKFEQSENARLAAEKALIEKKTVENETLVELRSKAKVAGIKGYALMGEEALIKKLKEKNIEVGN